MAVSPAANPSDLETAEIRNAGFHHVQVHFDVIISDAADFRSGENPLPIESSLPHRNNLLGLCGPALDVHGDEPAWIFHEIVGGVVALADGGNLKLELDELRVEKIEQEVIGALAVDGGKFEVLVMQALRYSGL